MVDDILINLLAWCRRERERLQMQREMLQSGRFRIFETRESGQVRPLVDVWPPVGANVRWSDLASMISKSGC
jgi:hypothetical protein